LRRPRRPAHELRLAIDGMPLDTRRAMLDGVNANSIIVGAYTDRDGGICPMLAAHRSGGRTAYASFAHAWDRYTSPESPRPATERELRTLTAMLEASIAVESAAGAAPGALGDAIADHRASKARRTSAEEGEARRTRRRILFGGFKKMDEYERAVAELASIKATHPPAEKAPVRARDPSTKL
jgi:hypothetical protein